VAEETSLLNYRGQATVRLIAVLLFLVIPKEVMGSDIDALISRAANSHGISIELLRAVVRTETHFMPWSFNTDGESFRFDSRSEAINALYQLALNPWMLKTKSKTNGIQRRFFNSEDSALEMLNGMNRSNSASKFVLIDNSSLDNGEAVIRRLNVVSTDIGLVQVNYRFHGQNLPVQLWFDPQFNLDYAASLLAKHRAKTGDDVKAAGLYHSGTPSVQERYLNDFIPNYEYEVANALAN
tara:strand:- start:465 stop:1181 length:717 start_codon:yes stop_codon:yes gene_type:complete